MTIQELSKKYDLVKDDYWFHKPSNQWIIKHDAVEKIATKEGIKLREIETLNSDVDLVRFVITMSMPNGALIKSIGEADRSNCFSQYLGCMAEKRGIDRCVLKGINAYQYGISSEVEAEDFKKPTNSDAVPVIEQVIAEEAELTGMPLPDKSQNGSKTPKNGLICPLCKEGVVDQRVEDIDGSLICPTSKNGKTLPAFKCVDNDDYKNPTCKFASWKLTKAEAGVMSDLVKDEKLEEAEELAQQVENDEDMPF